MLLITPGRKKDLSMLREKKKKESLLYLDDASWQRTAALFYSTQGLQDNFTNTMTFMKKCYVWY